MMSNKKKKLSIKLPNDSGALPIISSAAIVSKGLADGRIVPVLILDSSKRSDFIELVKAHDFLPPGDVTVWWGRLEKSETDSVSLFLSFTRPAELTVYITFNIITEGVLVDLILSAKSVFLELGKLGDRYVVNSNNPSIHAEIPDTEFGAQWDKMFHETIAKNFRKSGMAKKDATKSAKDAIEQWREIGKYRMSN